MANLFSKKARTSHMRRIRKYDTKPELLVRRTAHANGYRFRLYRRDLPGTPDLVFPRLHKAVLVHGCFWHQHQGCQLARLPKSRGDYWIPKFKRNQARDMKVIEALVGQGWDVLVIWECEAKNSAAIAKIIVPFLEKPLS